MITTNGRVDVLIPAFNAARTIRQAVASIQSQTLRDLAIIVVDDGSTDETPRVLEEIARGEPRLRVVTRPNGGIVAALNTGLREGDAPLIARHDADDIAYPDRLQRQVAFLQEHPACLGVSSRARHIDENDRPLGTVSRLSLPEQADPAWAPAREPYLLHPFLMIRRDAIERIGGYRFVYHAEDADLYWRLQEQGRLFNMDEVLGDYRMHAGSISSASLHNGRIMALSSQLSALSAQRRRAGQPDLTFADGVLTAYKAAPSLDALIQLASPQLAAPQQDHLRIAVAAKLLELAAYRPFELEDADCRFIAQAARSFAHRLSAANRDQLNEALVMSAVRLLQGGCLREARTLTAFNRYPIVLARLAFRLAVPDGVRRAVKRRTGRNS